MFAIYTRSEVVALTGLPEGQLKTLARRDQLAPSVAPYIVENATAAERDRADQSVQGWTRWSTAEVIAIAIQARLMGSDGYADGLGPVTAARLANAAANLVPRIARGDRSRDLWFGYFDRPADTESMFAGSFVDGTLPEVTLRIEAASADASKKRPLRAILTNVSAIVREVEQAASRVGIDFRVENVLAE